MQILKTRAFLFLVSGVGAFVAVAIAAGIVLSGAQPVEALVRVEIAHRGRHVDDEDVARLHDGAELEVLSELPPAAAGLDDTSLRQVRTERC